MIYSDVTITVKGNTATLDNDLFLYKNDKNITINISIVNSIWNFAKKLENNIIEKTEATFFTLRWMKGDKVKKVFEEQQIKKGKCEFVITEELIDEDIEMGDYDFQISLLDEEKNSILSIPPVIEQIHINKHIFEDEDINTVGNAKVGIAKVGTYEQRSTENSEGLYNKKTWQDNEVITKEDLNTIEEGIYNNSTQCKDIANELGRDNSSNPIDMGTTATTIRGAIKEIKNNINGNISDEQVAKAVKDYIATNGMSFPISFKNPDLKVYLTTNINTNLPVITDYIDYVVLNTGETKDFTGKLGGNNSLVIIPLTAITSNTRQILTFDNGYNIQPYIADNTKMCCPIETNYGLSIAAIDGTKIEGLLMGSTAKYYNGEVKNAGYSTNYLQSNSYDITTFKNNSNTNFVIISYSRMITDNEFSQLVEEFGEVI